MNEKTLALNHKFEGIAGYLGTLEKSEYDNFNENKGIAQIPNKIVELRGKLSNPENFEQKLEEAIIEMKTLINEQLTSRKNWHFTNLFKRGLLSNAEMQSMLMNIKEWPYHKAKDVINTQVFNTKESQKVYLDAILKENNGILPPDHLRTKFIFGNEINNEDYQSLITNFQPYDFVNKLFWKKGEKAAESDDIFWGFYKFIAKNKEELQKQNPKKLLWLMLNKYENILKILEPKTVWSNEQKKKFRTDESKTWPDRIQNEVHEVVLELSQKDLEDLAQNQSYMLCNIKDFLDYQTFKKAFESNPIELGDVVDNINTVLYYLEPQDRKTFFINHVLKTTKKQSSLFQYYERFIENSLKSLKKENMNPEYILFNYQEIKEIQKIFTKAKSWDDFADWKFVKHAKYSNLTDFINEFKQATKLAEKHAKFTIADKLKQIYKK